MADTKGTEKGGIDSITECTSSLSFDEKVIKKIVGFSVAEIPGILAMSGNFISSITDILKTSDDPTKGIAVEVGKKQVSINLKITCEYGRNIPAIFQDIIDKVTNSIKEMTGLDVMEVKVHVYDVFTKEEFQAKKKLEEKASGTATDSAAETNDEEEPT